MRFCFLVYKILFTFATITTHKRKIIMSKSQKLNSRSNVVYVKLPLYVGQFLQSLYGDSEGRIVLPSCSDLYACFIFGLRSDRILEFSKIGSEYVSVKYNSDQYMLSVSQACFGYLKTVKGFKPELYFKFSIPNFISRISLKETDCFQALTLSSCQIFRKLCSDFFWKSFHEFINRESLIAKNRGEDCDLSSLIDRFVEETNISDSLSKLISRNYYMRLKRNKC